MPPSDRSRSASPDRPSKRSKPSSTKGFKWKEKRPRNNDDDNPTAAARSNRDAPLERGYRNRSPPRSHNPSSHRSRSPQRERDRDRGEAPVDSHDIRGEERGSPATAGTPLPKFKSSQAEKADKAEKRERREKKRAKVKADTSEPMIIVNVNDRLGTKAAIPCLASDSVKAFKAMVAAHVGRAPHEILVKRQGERPFKDVLTLADYGVSNGVQLDLELDTGD